MRIIIKQAGSAIHPESALFVLARNVVADKVWPELKPFQFEVIQASLSQEDEGKLHEMSGPATSARAE